MKKLSFCLLYYNQPSVLERHVSQWVSYSKEVRKQATFVIIDDGSRPALSPVDISEKELDIRIFRIHEDLPWNIGGARNLAAWVAETKWILLQDLDIFIGEQEAQYIVNLCRRDLLCRTIYKFGRVNLKSGQDNPHPGTMLLPKKLYWRVGGCDEDFVGHYGFTDVHFFKQRVANTFFARVKTLSDIKLREEIAGTTKNLDRSLSRNKNLYEKKIAAEDWSRDYLRFSWSRVD